MLKKYTIFDFMEKVYLIYIRIYVYNYKEPDHQRASIVVVIYKLKAELLAIRQQSSGLRHTYGQLHARLGLSVENS
jgi:hypothetical protein